MGSEGTLLATASDLIDSIAHLISAIVWPLVLLLLLLKFGPALGRSLGEAGRRFLSRVDRLSVEAAGVRVSAEAAAAELTSAAVEAVRQAPDGQAVDVKEIAATASRAAELVVNRRPSEVLWVDDRPENNIRERNAMATLGMHVTLALSTDEALERLAGRRFDVAISDMGRPPDPAAGYTLLDTMRARGDTTPFVIYAGSNAPEHKQLAQEHGALGSTNRPQELLDLVLRAVEMRG